MILVLWTLSVPASAQTRSGAAVAFTAPLGAMAEAAIAVDPTDPRHLVAAADPYGGLVRIRLATSADAGLTWSPPTNLIPPGFAKSYDPVVFVSRTGAIVVVGGASAVGPPRCQTGSAIFMAVVNGGAVTFQVIRDARTDGAYVDRPGLVLSPVDDRAYVTWTESSGPRAACRGTPARSTVMLATGPPSGPFSSPVRLPTSGLPGPFGASPGFAADGSLLVAVGEHGPAQQSRVTMTTSTDGGHSFSPPQVVFDGASPPNSISGVSGFVAAVPSIAVDRSGRIAIAFGQTLPGTGPGAVVVERTDGTVWRTITPPAQPGTAELLPQVVYDPQGTLWMLSAQAAGGFLDLALRRRSSQWEPPINLARGSSGHYSEVGEALGLVATDDAVIAAAPINRTADSALIVASHLIPPPDPPPTTTSTPTTTTTTTTRPPATRDAPPPSSRGSPSRAAAPILIAAGAAVAALALSLAVLRRHRTGQRAR